MSITASNSLHRAFGPHLWVSGTPADCLESGQCLRALDRAVAKDLGLALGAMLWNWDSCWKDWSHLMTFGPVFHLGCYLHCMLKHGGERIPSNTACTHSFQNNPTKSESRTQHICRNQQASQKKADFWVPLHTFKGKVPCKSLEESRHNSWVCLKNSGKQVQWLNGFSRTQTWQWKNGFSRTQTWQWKIQSKWFKWRF